MFHGWENYYLLIGSAAAALIGLMFVVVTLTAGRDRDEVERGKQLYTSPIVWHLVPYGFPIGVIVYYLVWKHIVGRLNAIIGIA